jgi:hypothetical protein
MNPNEVMDKIKNINLGSVLKALPFDGGPSSTRVVFLSTAFAVIISLLLTTLATCWVYVHDPLHVVSVIMAGLIGTLATGATAFATNAQNLRHTLGSQQDSGNGDSTSVVSSTPLSVDSTRVNKDN